MTFFNCMDIKAEASFKWCVCLITRKICNYDFGGNWSSALAPVQGSCSEELPSWNRAGEIAALLSPPSNVQGDMQNTKDLSKS